MTELELYRIALKEIAHYGYQCEGYALEMQQIAEKAIRDGKILRVRESSEEGNAASD